MRMQRATSLEAPLVGNDGRECSRWRRLLLSITIMASAVVVVAGAVLLVMEAIQAGGVLGPARSSPCQAPTSVSNLLKQYARPSSIKHLNELLEQLPAHDVEDLVFRHIKPHVEPLYHDFLQYFGSTAPHVKTGKKMKRRHRLEDNSELDYRLSVFESFLRDAIRLNNFEVRHSVRSDHAVFGVTKFADWTFEEFQTLLKRPATKLDTSMPSSSKMLRAKNLPNQSEHPKPPCTRNWAAQYPSVFAPRDQGKCGSCYAYAAVEQMRAVAFLNTGIDQGELSAQYVIDCKGDGCWGGDAGDVMEWIHHQGGIPRKVDYGPYRAYQQNCKADIPYVVTTTGAERFYNEMTTANKLCGSGPLSMGVYANDAWQYYRSGVISHHVCVGYYGPNHDTQVVGVLEDKGAFLIRNSWGGDWGVNAATFEPESNFSQGGFILLEYGYNTCDLTSGSSFPKNVSCVGNCSHPTPAPTTPPPDGYLCHNTCRHDHDGVCDDGGPGAELKICAYGTDCDDCGTRPPKPPPTPAPPGYLCSSTCFLGGDGICYDGGPGSAGAFCPYGTDCDDCGSRPPLPNATVCSDTCEYAHDGQCHDGGPGSDGPWCTYGTDCGDCGPRSPDEIRHTIAKD
mmetsp:Transcript_127985/g.239459  ORF Transcript_127985/g.239459 Transcript_127985/m.239459 type:complete len:621 (-) Transcript_127985:96-1958(-)